MRRASSFVTLLYLHTKLHSAAHIINLVAFSDLSSCLNTGSKLVLLKLFFFFVYLLSPSVSLLGFGIVNWFI